MDNPPLPPGFVVQESAGSEPPPPPGFVVSAPPSAKTPARPEAPRESVLGRLGGEALGAVEAGANLATGIPAGLAGGLTYLGTVPFGGPDAAKAVSEQTQESLTYAPRSKYGRANVQAVGNVMNAAIEKPTEYLGDAARAGLTYAGASPEAAAAGGAAIKTGLQAIPYAAGLKKGGQIVRGAVDSVSERAGATTARSAAAAAAAKKAEAAARGYVSANTGLDWGAIPAAVRERLLQIASQDVDLKSLDPVQLERYVRAQSQNPPVPTLRADVTRDLVDYNRQEVATRAQDAGADIRRVQRQKDTALHENLSNIAKDVAPNSKVSGSIEAGASVERASRRKLQRDKADASRSYAKADKAGETAAPVNATPLEAWVKADPGRSANVGWVLDRLKAYAEPGADGQPPTVRLKNLEALHGELSAEAGASGRKGFYAGQAMRVVDALLDEAGGPLYKEARGKYKGWKDEFDRQKVVRDLTSETAGTSDKRVRTEKVTDYVMRSSTESIEKLKNTLTQGGSAATRRAGARAWQDLQAGIIYRLKEEAAGKRRIAGEAGQLQFNSSVLDLFGELDGTGKLEVLYGDKVANRLRSLMDTVRDVRTQPSDRAVGSQTAGKLTGLLEDFAKSQIPGYKSLKFVKGAVDAAAEAIGAKKTKEQVEAERAQVDPVSQSAADARAERAAAKKKARRGSTAAAAAPGAVPTYRQEEQNP